MEKKNLKKRKKFKNIYQRNKQEETKIIYNSIKSR